MRIIYGLLLTPLLGACTVPSMPTIGDMYPLKGAYDATAKTSDVPSETNAERSQEDQTVGSSSTFIDLPDTPKHVALRAGRSGLMNTGFRLTSFSPITGVITASRGEERGVLNISKNEDRGSEIVVVVTKSQNYEKAAQTVREIEHYITEFLIKQ